MEMKALPFHRFMQESMQNLRNGFPNLSQYQI